MLQIHIITFSREMEFYNMKRKRRFSKDRSLSNDSSSTINSKYDSKNVEMLPETNSLHHGQTDNPHLPKIFSNKKRVKIYETSKTVIEIPQRKRLRESKFFIKLQHENAAIQKLQKVAKEEVLKYQQQAASLDYAL